MEEISNFKLQIDSLSHSSQRNWSIELINSNAELITIDLSTDKILELTYLLIEVIMLGHGSLQLSESAYTYVKQIDNYLVTVRIRQKLLDSL